MKRKRFDALVNEIIAAGAVAWAVDALGLYGVPSDQIVLIGLMLRVLSRMTKP